MKDWKTTFAGVATIIGVVCAAGLDVYNHKPVNMPTLISGITAGVGLIKAADSSK